MDYGILSIVPILITLVIAFWVKNVFLALLSGILSATIIIGSFTGDFLTGLNSIATVFTDVSTTKTTIFVLMTGAIMAVVSRSGGVEGLVLYCTEKRQMVKSPVTAQLISFVLGLLLFVDGTSSIAITAVVGKPFFKKYKVPDEKLTLISNSTGSAVAWIVPFGSACAVLTTFFTPVAQQCDFNFQHDGREDYGPRPHPSALYPSGLGRGHGRLSCAGIHSLMGGKQHEKQQPGQKTGYQQGEMHPLRPV